ncbi:hypothetical protein SAMN05421670_1737 [Psychrobacillus psychrotolerans]|uniref:Uncharacterized protein n=1 Tax=Psychrobacillus psychrotolerans TaxID=126156 RepID=A0A1I5XV80_9BACI|nr:hypothetical protein SAMN05421670_1737 [Psychrobacillus psychrotolerans]
MELIPLGLFGFVENQFYRVLSLVFHSTLCEKLH